MINLNHYIDSQNSACLLVDVRTPAEYAQGHIPGAVNIPLLSDEQRHIIGTIYKKNGQAAAIEMGWQLVGNEMQSKANEALRLYKNKTSCVVYCWRGGLRSQVMTTLFRDNNIHAEQLENGYKQYRNWAIDKWKQPYKLVIIGGKTGVGKTEILKLLKQKGDSVIDLEGLANHKGSAYGGIEMPAQPTQEMFENKLAMELYLHQNNNYILVESESKLIGKCLLPTIFHQQFLTSFYIVIEIDEQVRLTRILNEYGTLPKDQLALSTIKISKRLGPQHAKQAIEYLELGEIEKWLAIIVVYYDKKYTGAIDSHTPELLIVQTFDWKNTAASLTKLEETIQQIKI